MMSNRTTASGQETEPPCSLDSQLCPCLFPCSCRCLPFSTCRANLANVRQGAVTTRKMPPIVTRTARNKDWKANRFFVMVGSPRLLQQTHVAHLCCPDPLHCALSIASLMREFCSAPRLSGVRAMQHTETQRHLLQLLPLRGLLDHPVKLDPNE